MLGALKRRILHLTRYRGDEVECPCCGHSFSEFLPSGLVERTMCLRCGSHARHRALWLFLDSRPELLAGVRDLLHFAPEHALRARLGGLAGYVSTDYHAGGVMVEADITALPFGDASFDAFICSHLLEHVADDRRAMGELARVLRPGGWGIVMVPFDPARTATLDGEGVDDPRERERRFGQHDHVRVYGLDIETRLAAAGFTVTRERVVASMDPDRARRYGLFADDDVWLCTR